MFSQACVKNSVHRGKVYTPLGKQNPRQDTPLAEPPTPPPPADIPSADPPPPRQLLQRTVRILLKCILVKNVLSIKISKFNINYYDYIMSNSWHLWTCHRMD